MRVVTKKSEIRSDLHNCVRMYHDQGLTACVSMLYTEILSKKVKFPLLEFCGHQCAGEIKTTEQMAFCDQIEALKTEGGLVILGIMLQNRLETHFEQAIDKTIEYTSRAGVWYVCDIIGERVYGYALLHYPAETIPKIRALATHPVNWVVRSLGAGIHYAVKKGLNKHHVASVFPILLSLATSKDKEIRQGIGWAAKTTARYHPDIITHYQTHLDDAEHIAPWFRKKIAIGLQRHEYAQRNSSQNSSQQN